MKRLREAEEPLERLFSRSSALGPHLGPTLYQLPARFGRDLGRLETFLRQLPREVDGRPLQHVMEFRDPAWYVDETFALLRQERVAICLHDKAGSKLDAPFADPFVYVRFHGTSGHYHGSYSREELHAWACRLAEQTRDGRPVFAYFNNDPEAVAVENALTLRSELDRLLPAG
jgi:uncharacterized protein YecE (DUF72 family)